jgi:hypothetical protein
MVGRTEIEWRGSACRPCRGWGRRLPKSVADRGRMRVLGRGNECPDCGGSGEVFLPTLTAGCSKTTRLWGRRVR